MRERVDAARAKGKPARYRKRSLTRDKDSGRGAMPLSNTLTSGRAVPPARAVARSHTFTGRVRTLRAPRTLRPARHGHRRLMQVMAAGAAVLHSVGMPATKPTTVAPPTRKVQDRARHPRLARELKTVRAMLRIYCHDLHAEDHGLCAGCSALMDYATRRLDRCVFGDDKPTCANCNVHCYSAAMREQVRIVMRNAGPRMLMRHPVLAIAHVIDGRRPAPELPRPAPRARATAPATASHDDA